MPTRYTICEIKYYTARVSALPHDPGAKTRQDFYLRAVATIPNCSTYYGYFLTSTVMNVLDRAKKGGTKRGHMWSYVVTGSG